MSVPRNVAGPPGPSLPDAMGPHGSAVRFLPAVGLLIVLSWPFDPLLLGDADVVRQVAGQRAAILVAIFAAYAVLKRSDRADTVLATWCALYLAVVFVFFSALRSTGTQAGSLPVIALPMVPLPTVVLPLGLLGRSLLATLALGVAVLGASILQTGAPVFSWLVPAGGVLIPTVYFGDRLRRLTLESQAEEERSEAVSSEQTRLIAAAAEEIAEPILGIRRVVGQLREAGDQGGRDAHVLALDPLIAEVNALVEDLVSALRKSDGARSSAALDSARLLSRRLRGWSVAGDSVSVRGLDTLPRSVLIESPGGFSAVVELVMEHAGALAVPGGSLRVSARGETPDRMRVFVRVATRASLDSGAGVGSASLAAARRIATRCGGVVESSEASGSTTVLIDWPREGAESPAGSARWLERGGLRVRSILRAMGFAPGRLKRDLPAGSFSDEEKALTIRIAVPFVVLELLTITLGFRNLPEDALPGVLAEAARNMPFLVAGVALPAAWLATRIRVNPYPIWIALYMLSQLEIGYWRGFYGVDPVGLFALSPFAVMILVAPLPTRLVACGLGVASLVSGWLVAGRALPMGSAFVAPGLTFLTWAVVAVSLGHLIRGWARLRYERRVRLRELLASQRRMFAAIAHELRAPLARLRANLDLLQDGLLAADGLIADLSSYVQTLEQVAGDLRDYTAPSTDRRAKEATEIRGALSTRAQGWQALNPGVRIAGVEGLPRLGVRVAPRVLVRAIDHLVQNALRYAGSEVRLCAHREGDLVCIEVADDGPGIPLEEEDQVLDPFYTTASHRTPGTGAGLGLGLSIVRQTTEACGGSLQIHRAEGGGARIVTRWPAADTT